MLSAKAIAKELLPPILVRALRALRAKRIQRRRAREAILPFRCPVCRKGVARFKPLPPFYDMQMEKYGYIHSTHLSETMNRWHYKCPHCDASDRDRLVALFLRERADAEGIGRVLDIAPSRALSAMVKKLSPIEYRTADLLMDDVDDRLDIMDMSIYTEGSFEAVLCSHVLEHVPDDRKAMRELHRVLSPTGWAVLMVPINLGLQEVCEDPTVQDPALRWKYFGLDDHVRLYSKAGFVTRLEEAGFRVEQLGVEHFGRDTFGRNGIAERAVLYVGRHL
jgi:SAM-dependent methyltransferase